VSEAADKRSDLRETYRKQLLDSIGGWTGTAITALPPVVFVVVNALAGLRPAIIAAIATGIALTLYRMARKQPVQQALSGLFGVLIAALIAARTGQARGYFLLGIWSSFLYAVPLAGSVLVRRPLVGVLWEFLEPSGDDPAHPGQPWYRRKPLLRAYSIATAIGAALFLSRGIVQATLYHDNATGWLAFARVAMGYPLYIAAVGAGYWVVRRARHEMRRAITDELARPAGSSTDDGTTDRRLGLG
jgi:type II secretory pathway pseudopilin PulG